MSNAKMLDNIIGQAVTNLDRIKVISGLLIAQMILSRCYC